MSDTFTFKLNIMGVEKEYTVHSDPVNLAETVCCLFPEEKCIRPGCKCSQGYIPRLNEEGMFVASPCENHHRKSNLIRLEKSGLGAGALLHRFDNFYVNLPWQESVKDAALKYVQSFCKTSGSFIISGPSGCGKTHLCTAICNQLCEKGRSIRYFQWVKDAGRLKRLVNDQYAYQSELSPYLDADVLYIDDLFKQEITAADIRLAYEIINERYCRRLPMIISSERTMEDIRSIRDGSCAAIAGRISEMSEPGCLIVVGSPDCDCRVNPNLTRSNAG